MRLEKILKEREKTHGDYAMHSMISQDLKSYLRHTDGWPRLSPEQKESVEMICHKIARILAGDPEHVDHWQDVAGYATLVAEYLEKS